MNDSRETAMQGVSSQQINDLADLIGIMAIEHPLQINDLSNRIHRIIFQHSLNVNQYNIMEVDEITEQVSNEIRRGRKRKYEEFIVFDIEVPEKRQRSK